MYASVCRFCHKGNMFLSLNLFDLPGLRAHLKNGSFFLDNEFWEFQSEGLKRKMIHS